ncbi:cysteine-rich motor neuron 1 protein-like [Sinocyclocheilus grahami]|uniref:cysteine-rich motor neuron 1 protein-like n=1 Tax=Sinocyclocheilus grahami TaxID=75366 RepID=UPI0007AD0F78|nr:PREDICTED: cysteine-rich motor neuron 1 protein-like [Sinocyclocheilus grahami]
MCRQSLLWLLGVLGFCARALGARECVPCGSARVLARDPCGCCERCSRLELELCGGPDWTLGYCGSGLTCAALNGTGPARIPETGVCRAVPDATDADERCPLVSGCESVDGECVCESKHSCIQTYSFPDRDACVHAGKTGSLRHRHRFVGPVNPACVFSGCNLTADGCVCSSQSCDDHFTYANHSQCQRAAGSLRHRHRFVGPVNPACVFSGCNLTADGCVCSSQSCDDHFTYANRSQCQRAADVELLSVESTKASCWVNHRLRAHEEQWKDDDCTFCQCVDGEPHCTAMACKQSCQNPVKIPGECCPFCEEPSYETVSPLLCPPLENCSLSGHDCPFGFQQDPSGCLLCQCVSNETCPDVSTYCSLECPLGYEKDNYGCEVCECSVSAPKCRPMTCSKTCPYGYMRNKHGCEMCRCIRCPPFTCDKHCGGGGFRKSRKGCSVCECEDADTVSSSFCLTASGQRFEDRDGWHDGCRDCFCHAGREMCVLITCSVPTCTHPVLHPNQCCPGCEDESGSGQLDGLDLVVCRAPGGELFVEGETWRLDECTSCTCRLGRVLCDSEACPPVLCHTPVRSRDGCCYVCPEDKLEPLRPEFCVSSSGEILQAGDSWKPNACSSCVCRNGSVQCFSQQCPAADCRVPVLRKGQCCPQCMLEITSTSVPVMLSTAVTESRITAAPEVLAVTDGEGLSRDVPSQTEMTLIYQSAAWILAGILLAVVIFLLVAILVNRRKNWVQMSCYGAPKKTVILQKHVNKSSLVYMEPSRENQFQSLKSDGSVSFPTDASGEQLSIPRAKLASGHVER